MQLAEEPLVEALAVSRNTVREALQRLSRERLEEAATELDTSLRRSERHLVDTCTAALAADGGRP